MKDADLARIVEELSREAEEDLTLQQVVDQAVANVAGCDMCSVFVRRNGVVEVGATTDALAREVDDLQFELDEGPCLTVVQDQEFAIVRDTATEDRWPRWTGAARERGVGSSLSLRLALDAPLHACLNIYARDVDAFDSDAVDRSIVYARLASVAIVQAREVSGLRSALHNRLVIGAAQGILMERYGLSLNRSFEVLRRQSNETNTKLHDVAQSVVDGFGLRT